MKTLSCKQLGGACELEFNANTFEEMAQWFESKRAEFDALPAD